MVDMRSGWSAKKAGRDVMVNLMGEFAAGDESRKPVGKSLGSSCWPIEKLFTMRFLIDPLGDQHEGEIFF